MKLNPISIGATSLADAWFQVVYKCLEVGRDFKIDQGSYEGDKRLEFDWVTIHIKKPGERPLLPKLPQQYNLPDPVEEDYLIDYVPYIMTASLKEGESYTYGNRLCAVDLSRGINTRDWDLGLVKQDPELWDDAADIKIWHDSGLLDQIETVIWTYKNKGHRNNQLVLQVAQPSDLMLVDPPCLRHIDTRVQDNRLHFFPYFRSWDLWGGFPANLAAIQLLKEYMAAEIGVDDGEMIVSSKGLHLYSYVWELAEILRGKTIEEFRQGVNVSI